MARPQALKRLTTFAVLLSLCSALFVFTNTKTKAAENLLNLPTSKISPDLRELIASGNGNRRVKLVVQTKPSAPAGLLGSLLNTVGGVLTGVLSNLNIRLVDTTASSADAIAADPDVTYVSLDALVRPSGHITTTTGTQQVRARKGLLGLPDNLDG